MNKKLSATDFMLMVFMRIYPEGYLEEVKKKNKYRYYLYRILDFVPNHELLIFICGVIIIIVRFIIAIC